MQEPCQLFAIIVYWAQTNVTKPLRPAILSRVLCILLDATIIFLWATLNGPRDRVHLHSMYTHDANYLQNSNKILTTEATHNYGEHTIVNQPATVTGF